jgi:hypothetical protein
VPTVINGLPAHVLFVHFVIVLVPLTALALVVSTVWTTWIRRLGIVLPILALATLISVPIATSAGEWLEKHTESDPLIQKHAALGDTLLPWVLGLFAVAVAVWWVGRRATTAPAAAGSAAEAGAGSGAGSGAGAGAGSGAAADRGSVVLATPIRVAAIVLAVIVSAGSVVQVYRIGDSGAKAAWHDGYSAKPVSGK